jgi:glyoxylase I family protein
MSVQRRQVLQFFSFAFGSSVMPLANQFAIPAQDPAPPASPAPPAKPVAKNELGGAEREKVTGIGGFFFRAHDPEGLGRWYQEHLGISSPVWQQEAGRTSFTTFPETTKYFGDPQKMWMLNFRVRDLDKMVAQLRTAGVEVKVDPQSYPYGRFASLHDPEGNPIQLWQPS